MRTLAFTCVLSLASHVALADSNVTIQPKTARPGDAVLVTVTGAKRAPQGTAADEPLQFFRARNGYQALFSVPLDAGPQRIAVRVDGKKRAIVVQRVKFPEADIVVEEEYANPPPRERRQIDADNRAIIAAMTGDDSGPKFSRSFRRPRGEVTSRFGEWRTFNDGHRSQHLGIDMFAREGTNVRAVNAGKVTLVRDTFLAGNVVVIAHGNGIATGYFHLSDIDVDEGDIVKAGDVVGQAGQTGRTTGPHLHLAVRVPGGFVDPARFFALPVAGTNEFQARRARRR